MRAERDGSRCGNNYLRTEALRQEGVFVYSEKQQQNPVWLRKRDGGEERKGGERGEEREKGCRKRRGIMNSLDSHDKDPEAMENHYKISSKKMIQLALQSVENSKR